ncbi:MAG: ABC transporter substrate-binding protein [Actinomycetota bacterium]
MPGRTKRATSVALAALLAVLAACSGNDRPAAPTSNALIVVNVPLARAGVLALQIRRGAELAAAQINEAGGLNIGGRRVGLAVRVLDSGLSPEQSAANVREAVRLGAVAVVDEGTGVDASYRIAAEVGLPIGIVYQGAGSLVDIATRRNVFRIAPTDRGVSFRLAEYIVPKKHRVAIITDDSTYGAGGAAALAKAFARNQSSIAIRLGVAAGATDLSAQILRARRAGTTALLVWARPPIVAQAVRDARGARWNVRIFTAISGGDPLVRQRLSDHPEWLDGMVFASSRLTAEKGPEPYQRFRAAYEQRFGADRVGVRSGGKEVVQPPDQAMYSYDFVNVLGAALEEAGEAKPGTKLLDALEFVSVHGANGDERGFNERNHEGVVDDDVFFAVIRGMLWYPVKDDALSATLPDIPQTL